jgi:hypothetical protein
MEIRYYASGQVLSWWRSYALGEPPTGSSGAPCGYPAATIREEPTSDGLRLDRRWVAWNHVERFFLQNFEWHHCRAHLLKGDPSAVDEVWHRWYKANPLMVTAELGAGGSVCEDMIAKRLCDALAGYNAGAPKSKQRTLKAALNAIGRKALEAWKPAGDQWRTTEDDIRRWVEGDSRRQHGAA